MRTVLFPMIALFLAACSGGSEAQDRSSAGSAGTSTDTAVFAGGCFWCVEEAFDAVTGVVSTTSGYMGGRLPNPTYQQISKDNTGHAEVVQVVYDPALVSYEELLSVFWRNIDPLTPDRQFCDVGSQYRAAVFYRTPEQRTQAERSKNDLERSGRFDRPIVTEVVAASRFYRAEEYHQDYHTRNPLRYRYYKHSCGRAQRLQELWGE
jgi:peptide-methionine (S)-S-oxide reductase